MATRMILEHNLLLQKYLRLIEALVKSDRNIPTELITDALEVGRLAQAPAETIQILEMIPTGPLPDHGVPHGK